MPDTLEQEVVAVLFAPETRPSRKLETLPPATKSVIPCQVDRMTSAHSVVSINNVSIRGGTSLLIKISTDEHITSRKHFTSQVKVSGYTHITRKLA